MKLAKCQHAGVMVDLVGIDQRDQWAGIGQSHLEGSRHDCVAEGSRRETVADGAR